jgi:hypothetical protein
MADESLERARLYKTSSKRLSTPLIVTVVLLLAVLLGGGYVFFQSQQGSKNTQSPIPTVTSAPSPTEASTPTVEATPSGKLTPTSTKATPTTKPTGVLGTTDRSDISVTVLNGSGVAGAASKISSYLKGLGYDVTSTGNAETFDYEGITISVKSGKTAILNQLKKDLTSQGTIDATSSTYTGTGDAEIIVGK